ncbi:RAD55 family ATPase [Candidatus Nanohalococcus occultus]|uniref:RAD55 family ATPase n=1 Tax=Candidatus Nanohalococcus occultus TaxID=2978047 RepID=UPI0039E0E6A1
MARLSTGTDGLDEFLEGGFLEGSVNLVTGGPGSGKTTMCSQYIRAGLENDEKCLYITTGQRPSDVRQDAKSFGIELDITDDNLSMAHVSPSENVAEDIKERIADSSFERIVLDSISVFEMNWGQKEQIRKYVNRLMEHFRDISATVLVTSERPESESGKLSRFGVAEFIVDGVILLNGYALGETTYRSARVIKMRRTNISGEILNVELNGDGLSISPAERL